MLGLGLGSILMSPRAGRVRSPFRTLAFLEGLLALTGTLVCLILRSDLTDSIVHAQLVAAGFNVPLPLVFGLGAALLLLVPCLLMGATIPLASEGCQRNLGFKDTRVLAVLFAVNTLGAVLGAMLASIYLIPWWGFTLTMVLSVGLNASAGLILMLLAWRTSPAALRSDSRSLRSRDCSNKRQYSSRFRNANVLMFVLGFCSLGYEMVLFRLFALELQPLPYTFASVLAGFLLFWSLGASQCPRGSQASMRSVFGKLALSMAIPIVTFYVWLAFVTKAVPIEPKWIEAVMFWIWLLGLLLCFAPCFFFGYLFAWITATVVESWGLDVGRIYAWNTAGSCLGVLIVTLFGYNLHLVVLLAALALVVVALSAHSVSGEVEGRKRFHEPPLRLALAGLAVLLVAGFSTDLSVLLTGKQFRMFFGRDGVVGVEAKGSLFWDGLWHSKLSNGGDHVGTNNWRMAVSPVLFHPTGRIRDACVIGLGTGITSTTLAKLGSLRFVDTYEINRGLAGVLGNYPAGTLEVLSNPKVRVIWQDARAGLTLRNKKYDVIVTQPLYLKQSGSGLLNSREFFELVRSRLESNGTFCLYSKGTVAQKRSVRETAAGVFAHGESFYGGYLLVLSQDPLRVDRRAMEERFQQFSEDPLWREIAGHGPTRDSNAVLSQLDRPRRSWSAGGLIVTDDHPVIEYPGVLAAMLAERDVAESRGLRQSGAVD